MELIVGGAYQGQLAYAQKRFPEIEWLDGSLCKKEELFQGQGVYDFQELIRRQMQAGDELTDFAKELWEKNPDLIIVTNEVGSGVVPMERFWRDYREKTGRICTELAAVSLRVHRVVCGIGTVIKEET